MPGFDYNSAENITKRIRDWDGSALADAKLVTDWNGTSETPVFSAEVNVLQNGVSHYGGVAYVLSGNMDFSGESMLINANSVYGSCGGIVNAYTNKAFDLSGMDALTFTVSSTADEYMRGYTSIYVGVVKSLPKADGSWLPSGWQNSLAANGMRVINEKEIKIERNANFPGTHTLDVSGLSGEHYITFCVTNQYGYDGSTNATFTNVLLS